MSLLCKIGLHKWRTEVVLRHTFEKTGTVINYDSDVCQRCETLRDPEGVTDAMATMMNLGGKMELHPPDSGSVQK